VENENLIRIYPARRVSPYDGMAITARVWAEAHGYHRQCRQLEAVFRHGPGILTGLEVIASDPPDSTLYVLPGIAIDPLGQVIVVQEPVAFDVAGAQGLLYLLLTYGESQPRMDEGDEAGPLYVHGEFGLEALLEVPQSACVELARVRHTGRAAPLVDAEDPAQPGPNEIDLRYRRQVAVAVPPVVTIAVSFLGEEPPGSMRHARGAALLARSLRRLEGVRAWVDIGVTLDDALAPYTLLYLVGLGPFELEQPHMQALYEYLQEGGTVFYESCRRDAEEGDLPADASCRELLGSLGVELSSLPDGHPLLDDPYLFAALPAGFETAEGDTLSIGGLGDDPEGVLVSSADYGCLWEGQRRSGPASREAIRAALEWGANLVTYALQHRQEMEPV
jgi:hypothetical protein